MDRVVFAVDRKQRLTLAASFGGDQFTRGDHAFFIREPDSLACLHGFVGGLEASHTHDRADHEVRVRMDGNPNVAGRSMNYFDSSEPTCYQTSAKCFRVLLRCDREYTWLPRLCLLKGNFNVRSCCQRDDPKALRIRLNHTEGAATNRAGRT